MNDAEFRAAVLEAAKQAVRDQERRDTCPKDKGGCGRKGVLVRITTRGVGLGKICPHPDCGWSTFAAKAAEAVEESAAKAAPKPERGRAKTRR
jgi:hypothetical protein